MSAPRPPVLDRARIERLAELFRHAGYRAADIRAALKTDGDLLARRRETPVQLRRLAHAPEPFAALVTLFVLESPIDNGELERRVGPAAELLSELGLVHEAGGTTEATVRLIPHDDLLIASDRAGTDTGAHHVAGVHRPSAGLAHLTIRRPVARALDVGTGNGIQALLCAPHAETVVATDLNERALEFAAFNAALNGVENVEFRHGSFFEPVEGERFGLVVSNPPYVITPDSDYLFRDGGLEGDEVSRLMTEQLPEALEEGGYGTMTASWVQTRDDADTAGRPRGWLEGRGCDVWIIHTSVDDPLTTAAAWNRDTSPDELPERLDRWLGYYSERSIEAVAYGAFVFRRRAGTNWVRACVVPRSGINRAGAHLARLFAGQDFLQSSSDEDVLRRSFSLHPDVRLEHTLQAGPDGWSLAGAELTLTDGLPFRAGLDEATGAVVRRLTPPRPLRELLADAGAELGVDADRFTPAGVAFVRQLVELGYVVPA
jgi:precorrin-6B methylase 2